MPSDSLQPMRWPSEWTDPALLALIAGSPVNCLLLDAPDSLAAVAAAARKAGVTVLDWKSLSATPLADVKWDAPAAQRVITGLVWPRIRLSAGGRTNDVQAGPTGVPWIDSNAWVAHLARVRGHGAPLWLNFEPAKDSAPPDTTVYNIAIADSAAAGARWIVNLDPQLRRGLAANNADAVKTWKALLAMLGFFEQHRKWSQWDSWGALGILSAFSGDFAFLGEEVLNLAARRNLHYRVLDRLAAPGTLPASLKAILYVDAAAPTPQWKTALDAFVRNGGMLIVPPALAAQFPGGAAAPCALPTYSIKSLGRGRVAVSSHEWDDPYFLAQEAHSLVSRSQDPVRLFNAGSLWEHYSESPDAKVAVLQLVGFSNRPYESVSIATAKPWRTASLYVAGGATVVLEPVKVDGRMEYHLPSFSYFAALEFGL